MRLPTHEARRYVTPLKEGGSLPAIVETDAGLWVVKFVGAGQGARALIAEILVGELARALGLPVPELALIELDASFGRTERDPEIQDLLKASVGTNVGLHYLDGALNYDPVAAADLVDPTLAADIVWLDAFTTNIDRTARNPNMMVHDEGLWLIDHGAALYFHHAWPNVTEASMQRPFPAIESHVLLPLAADVEAAHERALSALTRDAIEEIAAMVPDSLLTHTPRGATPAFATADENRAAYVEALATRLSSDAFVRAAEEARGAR